MDAAKAEELRKKLADLEAELADLKKRNPAHCSGTRTFVGPQMSPTLYQRIEDLEEAIAPLRKQRDEA